MPNLFIVRGLPGSGKSTLATAMVRNSKNDIFHLEADQFFTHIEPMSTCLTRESQVKYTFDRRLLGAAHDLCYGQAMHALHRGIDVVVSNTFTTVREINRYVQGVKRAGIEMPSGFPKVIKCVGEYQSVHNVPQSAVERMQDRWEDWQGEVTYNGEV